VDISQLDNAAVALPGKAKPDELSRQEEKKFSGDGKRFEEKSRLSI
jgi:hypothetical protein